MKFLVWSILLIESVISEPWRLKYPGSDKVYQQENQDITFNKNGLSQSLNVKRVSPQTNQNDGYGWVVASQHAQPQQYPQSPSVMPQYPQSPNVMPQQINHIGQTDEDVKIYEDQYRKPAEQTKVESQMEPQSIQIDIKDQIPVPTSQIQPQIPRQDQLRWDQGSLDSHSRPSIPQEYVLPPLYQSSYIQHQPIITPPAPIVPQVPNINTQYINRPYVNHVIPQEQDIMPMASSNIQYNQPLMNDEYSRMDSPLNLDNSFCADYNPETKSQVFFKDPNSNIHFLTCIGRNQMRRMTCPRYTVFNEYNKRCVQRQHANDRCGPCENGGQCIQDPTDGTYRCECPINFRGESCEQFEDPCKRNPCGSGLCFNISSTPGYVCQCQDHVFNDNCNENVINNCHQLGSKRFYAERGNLFVHCSDDGLAFVKNCPLGMIFNEAKETCTFPPSYTREIMVHPPGSFRSDSNMIQDNQSRPKRSTIWAW